MSTSLQKTNPNYPAFAMKEEELINVLRNSLYPGAQTDSIKMIIGYCIASGLDPMQKPVHIVPMWDSKIGGMRDVVMPGVGLYRTQASRTGAFAGQTEPEFGEMITRTLGGVEITYPDWARVTVKKALSNGTVAEFTAKEYWIENYAIKGGKEKSIAPNAMWMKRPRGQIGKCAAAQALRLAFPELGAQPTAEEMEGKEVDITPVVEVTVPVYYTNDEFSEKKAGWKKLVQEGRKESAELIKFVESKGKLFTQAQNVEVMAWKVTVIEHEPESLPVEKDAFLAELEAAEAFTDNV